METIALKRDLKIQPLYSVLKVDMTERLEMIEIMPFMADPVLSPILNSNLG